MKADSFRNPVIAFQGVALGPTPLKNKMEIQGAVLAFEGQHPYLPTKLKQTEVSPENLHATLHCTPHDKNLKQNDC